MRDWQGQSHVKWYCKYHIVFVPEYRRRAIFGAVRKQLPLSRFVWVAMGMVRNVAQLIATRRFTHRNHTYQVRACSTLSAMKNNLVRLLVADPIDRQRLLDALIRQLSSAVEAVRHDRSPPPPPATIPENSSPGSTRLTSGRLKLTTLISRFHVGLFGIKEEEALRTFNTSWLITKSASWFLILLPILPSDWYSWLDPLTNTKAFS